MGTNRIRGLVLSGGGARAAYQAGALKAIAELLEAEGVRGQPFQIYSGESAGAINACLLASLADDFPRAAQELWNAWAELKMQDILAVDALSLLSNASRWIGELSFGGLLQSDSASFLLDNAPLRGFLEPRINFGRIRELLRENRLRGLGVSVTNYATGSAITFYDSSVGVKPWERSHRLGTPTELGLDHVLASSAIPILFPPVRIGDSFYGDGAIRLKAPLSPAIHLGAEKILAIGLRYYRTAQQTREINASWSMRSISLADIAGVLLNAGFLDGLDGDLERLERINNTLALIPAKDRRKLASELRPIEAVALRPSEDLGSLAASELEHFGAVLQFLLKGLGASKDSGSDLMSYLAFDKAYTGKLLQLGYGDARASRDRLLAFFR